LTIELKGESKGELEGWEKGDVDVIKESLVSLDAEMHFCIMKIPSPFGSGELS